MVKIVNGEQQNEIVEHRTIKNFLVLSTEDETVIMSKKNKLIEYGKTIIIPEKHEEWKNCVLRHNCFEIEDSLKILIMLYQILEPILNEEISEETFDKISINKAKKIFFEKNYTCLAESHIRDIILEFSILGPKFCEETLYGNITPSYKRIIEDKKKENVSLFNKDKRIKLVI